MDKRNQKGFTLMEMLIVVAIIAILVAIAIPVFTSQLEKAREATDAANIRAIYAEAMMDYLDASSSTTYPITKSVALKQKKDGWQTADIANGSIAGMSVGSPTEGQSATVSVDKEGKATLSYGKASSK